MHLPAAPRTAARGSILALGVQNGPQRAARISGAHAASSNGAEKPFRSSVDRAQAKEARRKWLERDREAARMRNRTNTRLPAAATPLSPIAG